MCCMHYRHRNTTIKSFKQLRMQPFSMQQKYRYLKNETHNTKISADLGALCSTVEQHIVCSTVEQHIVCSTVEQHIVINILN